MSNSYYNHVIPVKPGEIIKTATYNNDLAQVEAGFNLLPDPNQLAFDTDRFAVTGFVSTNVHTLTLPAIPATSGYVTGLNVLFKPNIVNTGPVQMNINGMGLKELRTSLNQPLAANDLNADIIYELRYNGVYLQVMNQLPSTIKAEAQNLASAQINPAIFGSTAVGGQSLCAYMSTGNINAGVQAHGINLRVAYLNGTIADNTPLTGTWVAQGFANGNQTDGGRVTVFRRIS